MANPHLSDCWEVALHRFLETSPKFEELPDENCFSTLLWKLEDSLLAGTTVLADAEQKAYDVEGVKRWLTEFQDASFHAENILEDISIKVSRDGGYSFWRSNKNDDRHPLQRKMEGLVALLEHLEAQIKVLALRDCGGSVDAQWKPRSDRSPLYVGREADKLAFTNLLLSGDRPYYKTPNVISVNGMPGIGKTTLVQAVYNDQNLTRHFDLKVWISVGQDFDVFKVTKDVLHKITSGAVNTEHDFLLQYQLMKTLAGKRFLLVLDDVWSDISEWNLFLGAFTGVSEGSKIVVTTQSHMATSITQVAQTYQLKLMTDTECWELICSSVFRNKSVSPLDQELESVGKRIAEQCKGLPLAATTIASHLQSKPDLKEWYDVSNNFLYYTTSVLEVLRRSYDYLPCHLKRCFAFCSIFPKGYEFDRKKLVLLWMAVDLVYPGQRWGYERLEDIGNEYFDDLVARSFLQPLDYKKRFTMHDRMNDLAKAVAGEFCFRLEDDSLVQIPKRVRHLSFCGKKWDSSVASTFTSGAEYLRTFLLLPSSELAEKKALDPLPHFSEEALRCLRILSLSHYHITKLPKSFEGLKQLRYLDLSNTELEEIPEFVFSLHNLQTLFLSHCRQLRRLTAYIVQLISLSYLDLLGTPLVEMPQGISNLRNLQKLSNFVLGNLSGAGLQELRELSHLRGKIHISELQNVVSITEESDPDLRGKPLLKNLVLTWRVETSDSSTIACDQREVLKMLQPHPNMEKVTINSYGGATFPNWLGDSSFIRMTSVSLTSCSLCILLPPLGQLPFLTYLSIEKFKILKKVGLEFFYGENDNVSSLEPFSNLQSLSFYDMPRWEEWRCPDPSLSKSRIFPSLTKLTLGSCPSLKKFPEELRDFPQVISDSALKCEEYYGKISKPSSSEKEELHSEEPESSSQNYEEITVTTKPYQENLSYNVTTLSSDAGSTSGEMMPQQDQDDTSFESFQDDTSFESFKVTTVPELANLSESLKRLHIEGCPGLEFLPESLLQDCPNIQELLLVECHSLEAFPVGYPSTTLKTLYIIDCMKLGFIKGLQAMFIFPQLEDLVIDGSCRTLCSFPLVLYPNLKSLSIRHSEQLSSFTVTSARGDVRLLSLEALEITDCQKLEVFPEGGLRTLKLTSILISNCRNLKGLPAKMFTLASLQSIHINECPKLEANPFWGFPKSLQTLCISRCQKLRPKVTWLMSHLANLRDLEIEGGNDDVESFPQKRLLPFSLYSLRISEFKNLRTLDYKGLEDLPTLGILEISGCDKLASLPDEGLPSTLSLLRINGCPILKEKIYRKDLEWFKIKHIQLVEIDGEQLLRGRKNTEYLS